MEKMESDGFQTDFRWTDIFAAFCIICVVLGHAWGDTDIYIYQFHLAAFFFIRGVEFEIDRYNLESLVFEKIRVLIFPLATMVILLSPVAWYFDGGDLAGMAENIVSDFRDFVAYNEYSDMLGAAWFLVVMFLIFIIQRLIYALSMKHGGGLKLFMLITIVLYFFGYYLHDDGFISYRMLDIALVAQLFFGAGVLFRQYRTRNPENVKSAYWALVMIVCLAIILIVGHSEYDTTISFFPERDYPSVLVMATLPFVGILMMYAMSVLIGRASEKITDILRFIGKNTVGVLFLHFACFKIATLIFIPLGYASGGDLDCVLPPDFVNDHLWAIFVYAVVSLISSILIWLALCRIPFIRFFLGKQMGEPERKFWNFVVDKSSKISKFIDNKIH